MANPKQQHQALSRSAMRTTSWTWRHCRPTLHCHSKLKISPTPKLNRISIQRHKPRSIPYLWSIWTNHYRPTTQTATYLGSNHLITGVTAVYPRMPYNSGVLKASITPQIPQIERQDSRSLPSNHRRNCSIHIPSVPNNSWLSKTPNRATHPRNKLGKTTRSHSRETADHSNHHRNSIGVRSKPWDPFEPTVRSSICHPPPSSTSEGIDIS